MTTPSPGSVPPPRKSTNVRVLRTSPAVRLVFRALERAAPGVAGFWADRLLFSPPRKRPSPAVRSALEAARPFAVAFGRGRLPAWRWGEGPTVLLVHGWGSRGGHIASLAPALVRAGLSAVAFDAPAHGTAPGRRTSIVEMAAALRAVAAACEPVHGIVAHSVGAPVVTLALRAGLVVSRAVFLAPTAGPDGFTRLFAARLGLGPAGLRAMKVLAERRIGVRWEALRVPDLARELRVPLLVVHDRDDGEIAWSEGAAIAVAWPGAELVTTSGLGHVKLLLDPQVAWRTAAFLAEAGQPPASCGHVREWFWADAAGACATCALERDLFDRPARWERAGAEYARRSHTIAARRHA